MSNSENLGDDWQLLMAVQEQEQRMELLLTEVHREMVVTGKIKPDDFNELVYLTGVRANFGETNGKHK